MSIERIAKIAQALEIWLTSKRTKLPIQDKNLTDLLSQL
jgi:hypothetical protein